MSGGSKSHRREQAIAALLACATIQDAAKHSGVSEATIRRWLLDESFNAEYRAAKDALFESTINRLRSIGIDGVAALHRIATAEDAPAGSTVSAARAILETLFRGVELADLQDRIARLEGAKK